MNMDMDMWLNDDHRSAKEEEKLDELFHFLRQVLLANSSNFFLHVIC